MDNRNNKQKLGEGGEGGGGGVRVRFSSNILTTSNSDYLLHFVTIDALDHLCVTRFQFLSATGALVVMTTMARPKLVTTFKFDVATSFVMTA